MLWILQNPAHTPLYNFRRNRGSNPSFFLSERNIKSGPFWSAFPLPHVFISTSPFHPLPTLFPSPYRRSPSIPGSTFLWPALRGSRNATQKGSSIKEVSANGVLWLGSTEAVGYSSSLSATETQHVKQAFTRIVCAQSCRLKVSVKTQLLLDLPRTRRHQVLVWGRKKNSYWVNQAE